MVEYEDIDTREIQISSGHGWAFRLDVERLGWAHRWFSLLNSHFVSPPLGWMAFGCRRIQTKSVT